MTEEFTYNSAAALGAFRRLLKEYDEHKWRTVTFKETTLPYSILFERAGLVTIERSIEKEPRWGKVQLTFKTVWIYYILKKRLDNTQETSAFLDSFLVPHVSLLQMEIERENY